MAKTYFIQRYKIIKKKQIKCTLCEEEDEEELRQRGELTEKDVEDMFIGAEDKDYSVDHRDDDSDDDDEDDDQSVEWEEILIKEEPKPKVAGATMRFG